MKVLHVLYCGLGGHGNVFFSMLKADADKEMEYEALFYGIEDLRADYIEQCNSNNISWNFAQKKAGFDLKYYRQILHFIKKSNPDIVFLHGSAYILPSKIASLLSAKKYRVVVRETQANHLKTKAQWITLCIAMLLADKIVCLTKEFKEQIKASIKFFYRDKKVVVIPNGIDLDLYKPKENSMANVFYIGMQSRIVSIKDHTTLLKAFSLLKKAGKIPAGQNIKLKIAGDGDFKEQLIRLTNELEINNDVEFTGMLNEQNLVHFLQSLHLYVHASLGETMSTAVMQAMGCGLPIVASDVNGINNMIDNGRTGILVPVKNEQLMAEALIACITNPALRQLLAVNALQFSKDNFSSQAMLKAYQDQVFIN